MNPKLRPRQVALLEAIREYWCNAGIPPTVAELGRVTGISSTSVVCSNLDTLESYGLIRRTYGIARSIVLVERETVPGDIKRTLLDALKTEEEDFGKTAETVNARLWLEGKLHAAAT